MTRKRPSRALFDVNVLLDVLTEREPFVTDAARAWSMVENQHLHGLISADSFTTTYYIMTRHHSDQIARRALGFVAELFETVPVDQAIITAALASPIKDFEDAVQHQCALHAKADLIVSRDVKGYRKGEVEVVRPGAV